MTVSDSSAATPPAALVDAPGTVARDPHKVLGIVGFALSFFVLLNVAGLIISIIASVRSKRAGFTNGFAIAGVIIAGLGVALTITVILLVAPAFIDAAQTCARLGEGVHTLGKTTYTCTPTSFSFFTHF